MKRINSSPSVVFKATTLLLIMAVTVAARNRNLNSFGRDNWEETRHLADELTIPPWERHRSSAAHRQANVVAGTVPPPNAIKNEDFLPTNLFVTPDIELAEQHPRTESEGYLQVLQAMKYQPAGAAPVAATSTQKTISTKTGLNSALLKILTITKQFSSQAKSTLTSKSTTINKIAQTWAGLAFGNVYGEINGSSGSQSAAGSSNSQQVVYVNAPAENKTVVHFPNGTSITVDSDVEVDQNGNIIDIEAADEAGEVKSADDSAVASRLLSLMRMYSEHVENKHKEVIADESHYGHLKSMDKHIACLVDEACDFSKHLNGLSGSFETRSRHALMRYMDENQEFKPNHLVEFESQIATLIKALPGLTSNGDIRTITSKFINDNQNALNEFSNNWPQTNANIQAGLQGFNASLPIYQNLTPEQFLGILNQLSAQYKQKIDQEFTAAGLNNKTQELVNLRNGIVSLHNSLQAVIPVNGVLNSDFNELEGKLANHIAIFQKAQNASPEQLNAARIKLKNNLQMQINGIDPQENSAAIRSIANDLDAIMKSDFGASLNKDNLDFIIHKSLNALKVDFDQMKNNGKASGFMLDQADLQRVADDVVDELKKSREANQKVVLNLADFNKFIQQENRLYSAQPNSGDSANDAADLLISYENYYYDALSSDAFYNDLQNYVGKYYSIWDAHVKPLEPFFNYSAAYKTLTAGLDNPNALGNLNPVAVRLLMKSGALQVAHLADLSSSDKQFFHLFDHLMAEWAQTKDVAAFTRKLDGIISAVQGRATLTSAHLMTASEEHMAFALFESVKNAILGVIKNLGTGSSAASGLVDTISNGQNLVKQTADQYQVSDLLTANSTSTGIFGSVKNKFKSWLGFRNLEVHYGLTDTIDSVKNLWNSITKAKDTAVQLKGTINEAQGFANSVHEGINVFNSIVG